jgi:adenylate cyclase
MAREQRRLAAIVSADVVGYSRLMGRDEPGTLARLKALRREVIDPKITEYGGRIVNTAGDNQLLEFPSVVDAVRCSVDVQRRMAELNATAAAEDRLEFRIGINLGDIIIDGGDIFGDGVNVAARVQSLADPGGICVSQVVRDQVLDKLSFTFEDLGAQEVKNIARPVSVYRVALDGGAAGVPRRPAKSVSRRARWRLAGAAAVLFTVIGAAALLWHSLQDTALRPFAMSVAVLPIVVHGGSPTDERFAEVLSDNLRTILSRDRWTRVVAPGRGAMHDAESTDPRRLGGDLGVRYLAASEMHHEGNKVVVLVRLVDADTGADVWSDRFEFDATRAEGEPGRFAERIERRLWNGILASAMAYASSHYVAGDAWNAYLRASANLERTHNPSTARKEFGEVLQIDPDFVPALAMQAAAILGELATASAPGEARVHRDLEEVDEETSRAVALGNHDSFAWLIRAEALSWMERWDEALAASARAQDLDPGSMRRVLDRAGILLRMGHPTEALLLARQAASMDPETADTVDMLYVDGLFCRCNLLLGNYREATPACERLGAGSRDWRNQTTLAAVYAQQGEMAKAALAKAAAIKLEPKLTIGYLKGMPRPGSQAYLDLLDRHYYAGLRRAGFPEQ